MFKNMEFVLIDLNTLTSFYLTVLLLHSQVGCCKSTQIALKLRKNKDNDSR